MRMRVYAIYFSMRLGDAIDPCHLANGFEAVISYECQERRANPLSRIPRIHAIHARCGKASEWVGGSLPNKLEYKFLRCIPVHYQSRMTSNGIAITPSHSYSASKATWGG